jgi:hypothetical protein
MIEGCMGPFHVSRAPDADFVSLFEIVENAAEGAYFRDFVKTIRLL